MTTTIILLSIVVAIALGYFLKVNFGFMGIAFAFLCGCFIADFSAGKIIGMWPTKLFFQMFSVSFFYAFALNNGTMELMARKLVYRARNAAFLIPLVLWIVGFVLAGIGPGSIAMFLVLSPIYMQIAKETGMNPALATIVMVTGVNTGAWSPIAVNGITTTGLIEAAGYSAAEAAAYGLVVWRNMIIASIIIFIIGYVVFRGWKCRPVHVDKPADFNAQQKKSLTLIVILTALLVIPAALNALIGGAALKSLSSKLDPTFLAIIFGVISIIIKAGDEKGAIAAVPWKTLIMVCGMGMLVAVASEAGAMAYLSEYIGRSFSASIMPYVICIVAGIMSIFSSTMGVVIPTMYPLIFAICAASGANPAVLFSVVPISAGYTGMSPLSLTGGLAMAAVEEEKKDRLFMTLVIVAIASIFVTAALVALGLISA